MTIMDYATDEEYIELLTSSNEAFALLNSIAIRSINDLETALSAAHAEIESYKDGQSILYKRSDETKQEIENLTNDLLKLKNDSEELRQTNIKLANQNATLRIRVEEQSDLKDQISRLNKELDKYSPFTTRPLPEDVVRFCNFETPITYTETVENSMFHKKENFYEVDIATKYRIGFLKSGKPL